MPPSKSLRVLVREIRNARTAADERALINRECAFIRDSFRANNNQYRCRNVAKLLYLHMLGYPAHFGQLECLRLIASSRFTDKRVGYLGAMLLLDERADVHLLVTNSLKIDLQDKNQYVVSLALSTLSTICSVEMSRDLASEVERLIHNNNSFIKKKAVLCAFQIIRKVPELTELFVPASRSLFNDKNHCVLLASTCLVQEMCRRSPDILAYFRLNLVHSLAMTLKRLATASIASNQLQAGYYNDPFLEVKLLRLLRVLGHGDQRSSEVLNLTLTEVATITEASSNVGQAILYEIVLTIMGIESDQGLRLLAVNILGRFLQNQQKDTRYVALNTLLKVIHHNDLSAVQRHRVTILDCLHDPDTSIQRRAVDLCFALVNADNIKSMSKELLAFLRVCDADFKGDLCSNFALAAERYAPSKRWHFDSMLDMLVIAGNYARDDVVSSLIALIVQASELHSYATSRLFASLSQAKHQQPLVQAASWTIGEYGDLLINDSPSKVSNGGRRTSSHEENPVTEAQVVDMLVELIDYQPTSLASKQMLLTALIKLTSRFTNSGQLKRITSLLEKHRTSMNIDLQQRSSEFVQLTRLEPKDLRNSLLDHMPPPPSFNILSADVNIEPDAQAISNSDSSAKQAAKVLDLIDFASPQADPDQSSVSQDLFDLLNLTPDTGATTTNQNGSSTAVPNDDILNLFNSSTPATLTNQQPSLEASLDELAVTKTTTTVAEPLVNTVNHNQDSDPVSPSGHDDRVLITAINQSGIKVELTISTSSAPLPTDSHRLRFIVTASTSLPHPVDQFDLSVSVPKLCSVNWDSQPSTTKLRSDWPPCQLAFTLTTPPKYKPRMKFKITYLYQNEPKTILETVDQIPPHLWQ